MWFGLSLIALGCLSGTLLSEKNVKYFYQTLGAIEVINFINYTEHFKVLALVLPVGVGFFMGRWMLRAARGTNELA